MTSVTFKLADTHPSGKPVEYRLQDALKGDHVGEFKNGKLLTCTSPKNTICARLNNSLVGAIFDAYSRHYNLVLRPDDIWLTIIIAFADYIDNHAEEMREAFVTHNGQKQLTVFADSGERTVNNWSKIISQFSDEINKNTVNSVRDWIEPKFSTTTENDSLIGRVALMGAMKNYFTYHCCIECGIPGVTLMGTLDDWKLLRSKIGKLAEYGKETNQESLVWWHQVLVPVLDEFVNSYEGNVNVKFWQSCVNYIGGGSGPSYLTGWVLAFSPFKKGKWRINSPDKIINNKYGKVQTGDFVTSSTVVVPLTVNDNGYEYNAIFYAGGIVNTYDEDKNEIRPSFDFAMFQVFN